MEVKKHITNLEQVKLLVNTFYDKVRKDDLLSPIFEARIAGKWDIHLEKMYRFWQTVLLEEHTYYGSPFAPHANMPLEKVHFERWIGLFVQTVKENFEGEAAEEAIWRAKKMADMFLLKIEYFRNHHIHPIN